MEYKKLRLGGTGGCEPLKVLIDGDGDAQITVIGEETIYVAKDHLAELGKFLLEASGVVNTQPAPFPTVEDLIEGSPVFLVEVIDDEHSGEHDEMSSLSEMGIFKGMRFEAKLTNRGNYGLLSDTDGFKTFLRPCEIKIISKEGDQ